MEEIGDRRTVFEFGGLARPTARLHRLGIQGIARRGRNARRRSDRRGGDAAGGEAEDAAANRPASGARVRGRVRENIVEAVLSGKLDELEPQLTRNGYDLRSLVEQFAAKPAEIRQLLRGDLSGGLRRRSAGWARSPGNRPFSACSQHPDAPRRYPSPAFCVATLDLASVSPSLRSVSNSVRRTHPPVSATLCQKPPLIARRAVHHDCAPLRVLRWRSDPSRGEPRFLTVRQEGMCAGYCYRSPCWFAPLGSSQQSATPRRTVPWSFCRRNCGRSRRRRECAT